MKTQTDKRLEAKGDLKEKEKLIKKILIKGLQKKLKKEKKNELRRNNNES